MKKHVSNISITYVASFIPTEKSINKEKWK